MRHIGTDPRGEAVVLLGHKPDDNMVSFLRVSGLTDKEKEWLRESILKHHDKTTLMSQLVHESSRQTGANAGEYFYRRSETGPIRDIVLTDKDQCLQWTRGVTNYNPKLPNDAFVQSLTQAINPIKIVPPPAPVAEAVEAEISGPLAAPALGDAYYNQMANTEYTPPPAPVIGQPAITTNAVAFGSASAQLDAGTAKNLKRLIDQNDELYGQFKSLKKQQKEMEKAIRAMSRELKAKGVDVNVLPKLEDGESE